MVIIALIYKIYLYIIQPILLHERHIQMNLNNLYYFKVMAEYQHYTRAAQSLYITQPSLSHAIASLEKELGVQLFEKEGRNVKLTKYGQLLATHIAKGFAEIEKGDTLLRQFSRQDAGIIDFSFLFVLGYKFVPQLIKSFYEEEKHKNITIHFNQCDTQTSIDKLREGGIDVSLCTFIPGEAEVEFTPIFRQELVCIVGENHPLAAHPSVTVDDVVPFPVIRYVDAAGEIQTLIDNMFLEAREKPTSLYNMAEEITMAGMVSTGHRNCIAIVPNLEILRHYPIKKIPLRHPQAYRNIFIATAKDRPAAPCLKLFRQYIIHFAKNVFGNV